MWQQSPRASVLCGTAETQLGRKGFSNKSDYSFRIGYTEHGTGVFSTTNRLRIGLTRCAAQYAAADSHPHFVGFVKLEAQLCGKLSLIGHDAARTHFGPHSRERFKLSLSRPLLLLQKRAVSNADAVIWR